MRIRHLLVIASIAALFAGAAMGDSLSVTSTAAMGGVADQNCTGDAQPGPCGLDVAHDNSSTAFVQDDSPQDESIYRYSFLFNPNNISPENGNWRHTIFWAQSLNTRPGNGTCPVSAGARIPATRVFLTLRNGGTRYGVRAVAFANVCGKLGTINLDIPQGAPSKICGFWEQGTVGVPGSHGIAVVGSGDPCPTHGDAAYATNNIINNELSVFRVQMGSLATNTFGRGENGSWYLDEFESFRTLAP